jgi:predicted GNAT family N-acyltransferase
VVGEQIEIRWARDGEDFDAALAIRIRVFCGEQGVPREEEPDELDASALHLLALAGGHAVGTLRLLLGELGSGEAKIGRVAVDAPWRHRGIASSMLAAVLARAREEGARTVRLAAQVVAIALYEQAGFVVTSEPFEEAGIAHVWMTRELAAPAAAD